MEKLKCFQFNDHTGHEVRGRLYDYLSLRTKQDLAFPDRQLFEHGYEHSLKTRQVLDR